MKEFDYSQVKHYKLYNFIKTIFRPLVKLVYKMQFKGLENIPSDGTRYIVAINHTCALDPVFAACPSRCRLFTLWQRSNFSKIRLPVGL